MKVIYAVLLGGQEVFHPALHGALKGTVSDKGYPGIQMSLVGSALLVEFKGRKLVVPLTRFAFVELSNAEETA